MKSSALSCRPAGMSNARGPIWDSVNQGWRNNSEVLRNSLYKELTVLVHQKSERRKKSVLVQHVFLL